jgi:hypothetical protein
VTAQTALAPVRVAARLRLRRRHLWIIPGLAIAILGSRTDSSLVAIGAMVAGGIAPHLLAVIAGIGQSHPEGRMPRRGLAVFNAMHEPIVPAAIVLAQLTGLVPTLIFVVATAWLSHIVIGWGIGDRKRSHA